MCITEPALEVDFVLNIITRTYSLKSMRAVMELNTWDEWVNGWMNGWMNGREGGRVGKGRGRGWGDGSTDEEGGD